MTEKQGQRRGHDALPRHVHALGDPWRYCVCGEAIVQLGQVWYHIQRRSLKTVPRPWENKEAKKRAE